MTLQPWKKLSEEVVASNPWWEYRRTLFEVSNGAEADYHSVHMLKKSISIVAVTSQGTIPFVQQFRGITGLVELGLPSGYIDGEDDWQQGAEKELAEEVSLGAKSWEQLPNIAVTPGLSDQWIYSTIAYDVFDVEGVQDATESINVFYLTPEEIDEKIASGEINTAWAIVPWVLAKDRVLEIIDRLAKKS